MSQTSKASARAGVAAPLADREMQVLDAWARAGHVSMIGLFVIALLWCTYVASPVIVPVMLAWVIATMVLPVVNWVRRHRVPHVLAVLGVTLALIARRSAPAWLRAAPRCSRAIFPWCCCWTSSRCCSGRRGTRR